MAFKYFNFLGIVPDEFDFHPTKEHAWETESLTWVSYAEVVADMEKNPGDYHPGMLKLFANSKDAIERALKVEKQAAANNPIDVLRAKGFISSNIDINNPTAFVLKNGEVVQWRSKTEDIEAPTHLSLVEIAYGKKSSTLGFAYVEKFMRATGVVRIMYPEFEGENTITVQSMQKPTPAQVRRIAQVLKTFGEGSNNLVWEVGGINGLGSLGEFQRVLNSKKSADEEIIKPTIPEVETDPDYEFNRMRDWLDSLEWRGRNPWYPEKYPWLGTRLYSDGWVVTNDLSKEQLGEGKDLASLKQFLSKFLQDLKPEKSLRTPAVKTIDVAPPRNAIVRRDKSGAALHNVYNAAGAKMLADYIGAKVVGGVATKGTSTHDLDLQIEQYDPSTVEAAMKVKGFEPTGSSILSPQEIKGSGKSFGTTGDEWARAHHFENSAGQKVDVWHTEPELEKTGAAVNPIPCPSGKRKFYDENSAVGPHKRWDPGTPTLRAYKCPCGWWHLTSKPQRVTAAPRMPKKVYHGTNVVFDENFPYKSDAGVYYFTDDIDYAGWFADRSVDADHGLDEPKINVFKLDLKKPFDARKYNRISAGEFAGLTGIDPAEMDDTTRKLPFWKWFRSYEEAAKSALQKQGYDGIVQWERTAVRNSERRARSYIAFSPEQFRKTAAGHAYKTRKATHSGTWVIYDAKGDAVDFADSEEEASAKVDDPNYQPQKAKEHAPKGGIEIVYRGEGGTSKKGGPYWSPSLEFAAQFTQTGRESEVRKARIRTSDIYEPSESVYGGDPDAIDVAVAEAKKMGLKAVRLSEGNNQPLSVYVFDRSALKTAAEQTDKAPTPKSKYDKVCHAIANDDKLWDYFCDYVGVSDAFENRPAESGRVVELVKSLPPFVPPTPRKCLYRGEAIRMGDDRLPAEWEPHLRDLLSWSTDYRVAQGFAEGRGIVWRTVGKIQGVALYDIVRWRNETHPEEGNFSGSQAEWFVLNTCKAEEAPFQKTGAAHTPEYAQRLIETLKKTVDADFRVIGSVGTGQESENDLDIMVNIHADAVFEDESPWVETSGLSGAMKLMGFDYEGPSDFSPEESAEKSEMSGKYLDPAGSSVEKFFNPTTHHTVEFWFTESGMQKEATWLKKAAGFAFKTFKKLWHVGSMDAGNKQEGSLEGSGLSVSVNPEEWMQIAGIGGDLWELTKPSNRFLNFHRLSKQQRQQIMDWGVESGYATEVANAWRLVFFDSETEEERYMEFPTEEEAKAELGNYGDDEKVVPAEGKTVSGTDKLKQRTKNPGANDTVVAFDLLVTVYAEDELDCDGVWWQDTLDPASLSAPRGVIFPSKLPSWTRKLPSTPRVAARRYSAQDVVDHFLSVHPTRGDEFAIHEIEKYPAWELKLVSTKNMGGKLQPGDEPELSNYYATLKTPFPPVILGSDGHLIDGMHRCEAAGIRGEAEIWAYMPVAPASPKKTASALPPVPGTAPIPAGAVRCFHYTEPKNTPSIKQQGLLKSKGRGDDSSYSGPSAGVWASTQTPDYNALRNHFYIEFWAMPEDISHNANYPHKGEDATAWGQGREQHVIMAGDVPPDHILAIHEPWQDWARYLEKENHWESLKKNDPKLIEGCADGTMDKIVGFDCAEAVRWMLKNDPTQKPKVASSLTLYHGSPTKGITRLDLKPGVNSTVFGSEPVQRSGIFLTPDKDFAASFAGKGGEVTRHKVNFKNIADLTEESYEYREDMYAKLEAQGIDRHWLESAPVKDWERFDGEDGKLLVDALKKSGYDGAKIQEDGGLAYIAFSPDQISPAEGTEKQAAEWKKLPATDEWVSRAEVFMKDKWEERHKELGREGIPTDLSGACKFASMFAQKLFGGKMVGTAEHQALSLGGGKIVDLTDLYDPNTFYHDEEFWENPEHEESLKSCEPRVQEWVDEFMNKFQIDVFKTHHT